MYRVDRNNFYANEKNATIYIPQKVSQFLFSLLDKTIKKGIILDTCVEKNYLTIEKEELEQPNLIIMNPPFNINKTTKEYIKKRYGGRPLLPEIWLMKAIELFGRNVPIVMLPLMVLGLIKPQRAKGGLNLLLGNTHP